MMSDEGGQMALQVSMQISSEAVRITAGATRITAAMLTQVMRLAVAGLGKAKSARLDHGKMSIKHLQRLTGGDLHTAEIGPEMLRSATADLRRRGISFAVEKGADGKQYIHISGRDVDSVQHGLAQVETRLAKRQAQRQERREATRQKAQVAKGKTRARAQAKKVEGPGGVLKTRREVLGSIKLRQAEVLGASQGAPRRQRDRARGVR